MTMDELEAVIEALLPKKTNGGSDEPAITYISRRRKKPSRKSP